MTHSRKVLIHQISLILLSSSEKLLLEFFKGYGAGLEHNTTLPFVPAADFPCRLGSEHRIRREFLKRMDEDEHN